MKTILSIIAATAVLASSPAMAAGYLKIGDIKGESEAANGGEEDCCVQAKPRPDHMGTDQRRSGVRVASGDVNGAKENGGRADVITAPGAGGGPHVKVFNGTDGAARARTGSTRPATPSRLRSPGQEPQAALLLPAVQSAREAARR
ncbi:hypothetical protein [Croceicoccus naphthovorans]|nr:hypothetical protein [Croceicoccus naphthovorans]MBB3989588.1 hypothetical protein [Croceicoccus naphthovorans]